MSRTTKWLLVASSLWYFGEGLFGPLFAVFSEKVGGDLLDITWAWAAIGGLIAYHFSFDSLFVIMGCIQLIATIIQFRIIANPSRT